MLGRLLLFEATACSGASFSSGRDLARAPPSLRDETSLGRLPLYGKITRREFLQETPEQQTSETPEQGPPRLSRLRPYSGVSFLAGR
ncbi:hypothetical protein IMZ48_11815 [Candidatus Bathyarchaeota archaeon]|nr:hypothetical protein [Candidatus Bathyarchaeota archaeon]